jgi:hypothetical protein
LSGSGCSKCGLEVSRLKQTKPTEEFILEAGVIHKEKYDYSNVVYINSFTKVCIVCPKHGMFMQAPVNHLEGSGCMKCYGKVQHTNEEFIYKANVVHSFKYDYSKTKYTNLNKKVIITCLKHGDFFQEAYSQLTGCGCPRCYGSVSKEEKEFIKYLKENNKTQIKLFGQHDAEYEDVVKIIRLKIKRKYRPDLILKNASELIICEYDGSFWHPGYFNCREDDIHPILNTPIKIIKERAAEKENNYKMPDTM